MPSGLSGLEFFALNFLAYQLATSKSVTQGIFRYQVFHLAKVFRAERRSEIKRRRPTEWDAFTGHFDLPMPSNVNEFTQVEERRSQPTH